MPSPILESLLEAQREHMQLLKRLADLAEREAVQAEPPQLTPTERRIWDALDQGVMRAEQLAKILDLEYSGSFKQTLAAMVRFRILLHSAAGYSRHPAARTE